MTSAEEVPRTPCSIGARQAELPAPEEELVHVFFASTCNFDWPYFGPQARPGAHTWRDRSMANTEEVQCIPSSIGACEIKSRISPVNTTWILMDIRH
jgi:hypothetical protein